jgi:hypothetical protein
MSSDPAIAVRRYNGFPSFADWSSQVDIAKFPTASDASLQAQQVPAEILPAALQAVVRVAAVDTGAIEGLYEVDRGFTMTAALGGAMWDAALSARPQKTQGLIRAQVRAYERLIDHIKTDWPLTEASIRSFHEEVCASQETFEVDTQHGKQDRQLPKGKYKDDPNTVITQDGVFEYCPPDRVSVEMAALVRIANSPEFEKAAAILQASWLHYAFILVHPFSDGNGRVARLLGSLCLFRRVSAPLLVYAEERSRYFSALREADEGRYESFVAFCARSVQSAFDLLRLGGRTAQVPDVAASIHELKRAYVTQGGIAYERVDGIAKKLLLHFRERLAELINEARADAPAGELRFSSLNLESEPPPEPGYRVPRAGGAIAYQWDSTPPIEASITGVLKVEHPKDAAMQDTVRIRWAPSRAQAQTEVAFEATVESLLDGMTQRLQMEAEMAVRYVVGKLIAQLAAAARDARLRTP